MAYLLEQPTGLPLYINCGNAGHERRGVLALYSDDRLYIVCLCDACRHPAGGGQPGEGERLFVACFKYLLACPSPRVAISRPLSASSAPRGSGEQSRDMNPQDCRFMGRWRAAAFPL